MYFLLNHKYENINLRQPPKTHVLLEQKMHGLSELQQWWFEVLCGGSFDDRGEWQSQISKDEVYESYLNFSDKVSRNIKSAQTKIGMFLKKMVPNLHGIRGVGILHNNGIRSNSNAYVFPSLEECRKFFEKEIIKQNIDWCRFELSPKRF